MSQKFTNSLVLTLKKISKLSTSLLPHSQAPSYLTWTLLQSPSRPPDHPQDAVIKKDPGGTSLVAQWLRLCASNAGCAIPWQGAKIAHIKRPKHKTEAYCNKFNKDFKSGSHPKKKNLKKDPEILSSHSPHSSHQAQIAPPPPFVISGFQSSHPITSPLPQAQEQD